MAPCATPGCVAVATHGTACAIHARYSVHELAPRPRVVISVEARAVLRQLAEQVERLAPHATPVGDALRDLARGVLPEAPR